MTIAELVLMARRIHDTEGHNLGANSTRESRNAFWMRVVGCAHHGHPAYNPNPDTRWHVKNAGGGRPMSDDVVVLLPSREAWDCIRGAGASGYSFHMDAIGVLPAEQVVYAPVKPSGWDEPVVTPPVDPPVVVLPPVVVPPVDVSALVAEIKALREEVFSMGVIVLSTRVAALEARNAAQAISVGKAPDYTGKLWGQAFTLTPKDRP